MYLGLYCGKIFSKVGHRAGRKLDILSSIYSNSKSLKRCICMIDVARKMNFSRDYSRIV